MQAIVALLALLSFAEASLKTPRTAISPNPSSTTTTTLEAALSSTTIPATSASSTQLTSDVDVTAKNRNTVFPLDEPTSSSTMAASNPKITPSPELNPPGANFHEMNAKYVQTTYWSCVTFPLETHCGWHQPILDAGAGRIGCEGRGQAALRAGVVAGVIAGGLVLGM